MAAGVGSRMRPVTLEVPKPLVKVNGQRMIDSVICGLHKNGIYDIYIVVGYLKEQFKKLTGETDEELVSSFLLKSQNTVLSKTNRSELIDDLNDYVLKLAIALYNRQGNEGLASYSEGGESESYQSEDEILSGISNYRLSAMARRLKDEKKKSQEVSN